MFPGLAAYVLLTALARRDPMVRAADLLVAAIVVEDAQLLDGTRMRAAAAARRRIAADLHDGVAQSLTHLRMELELLARRSSPTTSGDADRLATIAGVALADLRATIGGLRRPLEADLAEQLDAHLQVLRGPHGPCLELEVTGRPGLFAPDRAEDVLRIAQEAIANAMHHAEPTTVTVTLERDATQTVLVVEDDGVGVESPSRRRRRGGRRDRRRTRHARGGPPSRPRSGGARHRDARSDGLAVAEALLPLDPSPRVLFLRTTTPAWSGSSRWAPAASSRSRRRSTSCSTRSVPSARDAPNSARASPAA